jgi:hypothetical protein
LESGQGRAPDDENGVANAQQHQRLVVDHGDLDLIVTYIRAMTRSCIYLLQRAAIEFPQRTRGLEDKLLPKAK